MLKNRCDIILPTCDQLVFIKDCIESLIRTTKYSYRLIVINDGKSPEARDYLDAMAKSGRLDMTVIKPKENLGWIRAINTGLSQSTDSKYVCFQNDDTVFTEGWLEELVDIFEKDPKIGIANPEWEKPEGASADEFAKTLKKYKGKTTDIDWCRGHCFFISREVVQKLGGFDTVYVPVYYDDRDYSLKAIEAGYRCVKARSAFVDHVRNVTMKKTMAHSKINTLMERNGRIFYKRWGYPLRLVFILKDPSQAIDILKGVCMDQNKVAVISARAEELPYEHTNLKKVSVPQLFFRITALFYILARRSKKRQKGINFIFTDDKAFYGLTRIFKPFLPAEVIFDKDILNLSNRAGSLIKDKKAKDKDGIVV